MNYEAVCVHPLIAFNYSYLYVSSHSVEQSLEKLVKHSLEWHPCDKLLLCRCIVDIKKHYFCGKK